MSFCASSEEVEEYPTGVYGYDEYPIRVLTTRRGNAMTTNEFQVTGMTCGHCEMSIREEVSEVPGVEDIQVSAQTGTLVVTGSGSLDDAQILAAVAEAGYSAVRTV